ncbi:hypothetical protein [Bdellovibrio bacteriovorus]|uniref:PEGA domain-containing protein n=1 Tax=Bdellovibrio bacteriovorus TaxID=959 RepID=A0A1Z3N6Y4_BDEBC|nr:hypothetical protein [Bdellovibrio bacteriovorus]AHZ85060.1 hypothetical protein EP01_08925 [Bdellovibrio bacteriovorus]ASD63240.1 hypothetical protein B9G79_06490 [Bdellovibrio bacteriovorus]BEV68948.1 hypothetical protein Bb109J_c2368 [Bdellovibrio bacteriovorus]
MTWFKNLKELLGLEKPDMCLCMVVSEQEGAEIWVEGQRTNYFTPKLVAIKKDHPVKITVKMIGHEPHTAVVKSSHNLTYYYCNLERIPLRLVSNEVYRSAHR